MSVGAGERTTCHQDIYVRLTFFRRKVESVAVWNNILVILTLIQSNVNKYK